MSDFIQQLYKLHTTTPKAIDEMRMLEKKAYAAFGKLNGWTHSSSFDLNLLSVRPNINEATTRMLDITSMLDHATYYKKNGKPVAIVGQPYARQANLNYAKAFAKCSGLELHLPKIPQASIHYPNVTVFFVFARPGTNVQWLPEQTMTRKQLGWDSPLPNSIAYLDDAKTYPSDKNPVYRGQSCRDDKISALSKQIRDAIDKDDYSSREITITMIGVMAFVFSSRMDDWEYIFNNLCRGLVMTQQELKHRQTAEGTVTRMQ